MERVSKSALGIFSASLVSSPPCQTLTPEVTLGAALKVFSQKLFLSLVPLSLFLPVSDVFFIFCTNMQGRVRGAKFGVKALLGHWEVGNCNNTMAYCQKCQVRSDESTDLANQVLWVENHRAGLDPGLLKLVAQ